MVPGRPGPSETEAITQHRQELLADVTVLIYYSVVETATLGTLLRHLVELLDGAVAEIYRTKACGYRPRFTPVVRVLLREGPSSIKMIATSAGLSHSAISQTVSEMVYAGMAVLRGGRDQRERIVDLTPKARRLIPVVKAQWACIERAARSIDADVGIPVADILRAAIAALEVKPFAVRIAEAKKQQTGDR